MHKALLLYMALLLIGGGSLAQNLIPNPGFEEPLAPAEFQWVQPQGPFYHYEKKLEQGDEGARTGQHINGLCMYNHEPNEYLHVKLREPLVAGERYAFSVHARLYTIKNTNYALHNHIGVHFGSRRLDTQVPGDLPFNPQLHLRLPDGPRYGWFELRDTLVAKGGEQYLTMGYFPRTQRRENDEQRKDAFMAEVDRMYQVEQYKKEQQAEKKMLYLSPAEQQAYLKEQKKLKRRSKKQVNCPSPAASKPAALSQRPIAAPVAPQAFPDELFTVRYYFDDFCLAPLVQGEARCEEELATEEISKAQFSTGATIALPNIFFETDKDVLLNESVVQLEGLQATLERYPSLHIEIRGHTDRVGSDAHNRDLSKRRAAAVVQWLQERGISPARLSSAGFGATRPIADNDTEAGRARNRRVEFYVLKGL